MPSPLSTIGVSSPLFGADGRPMVDPGAFLVTGEDNLRINSWNSLAGVVLSIRIRFLNEDGQIVPYVYTHTPNTNRTKASSDFPLGIGFPLNVQIVASSGTPLIGQTFVQAQIIRGLGGSTVAYATLLQDYVTSVQTVAWPGSPIRSSLDAQGNYRIIAGTTPAAGAEIAETVPTGARWRLVAFRARLATSAVVATRRVELDFTSGGVTPYQAINPMTLAANSAGGFNWGTGLAYEVAPPTTVGVGGLPNDLFLPSGATIGSSTTNMDVGDQWTQVAYLVQEFLEVSS